MKRAEKILIALALISIIGDMFHVTGATFGIVLSAGALSFFYLFLSFALFKDEGEKLKPVDETSIPRSTRLGIAIFSGISLSAAIIGVLFTFQLWPAADIQLNTGLFLLAVVVILLFALGSLRGTHFKRAVLKRIALFGGVALFFFFLPTKTLLTWHYPDAPEYIDAVVAAEADPTNEALKLREEEEWEAYNAKYLEELTGE